MKRSAKTQSFLISEERPLAAVGMSFLAAALVVSFFDISVSIFVGICLAAAILAALLFRAAPRASLRLFSAVLGAVFFFCFLSARIDLSSMQGQTVTLSGQAQQTTQNGALASCVLSDVQCKQIDGSFRVMIYLHGEPDWNDGDILTVSGKVFSAEQTDGFDSVQFLSKENLAGNVLAQSISVEKTGTLPPRSLAKRANDWICVQIKVRLPGEAGAVFCGMLLGNTDGISDRTTDAFRTAGVAHLFSVSGFHIMLVSLALKRILRRIHLSNRKAAVIALFAAWGYVFLSGGEIPAVRAGIMISFVLAGGLFGRRSDSLNSLFGAALFIVLSAPYALTSASFLLSFSATLGLCVLAPKLLDAAESVLPVKNRAVHSLLTSVCASTACSVSILPVSAYFFGGVSLVSPLANLFVCGIAGCAGGLFLVGCLPGMQMFYACASSLLHLLCEGTAALSALPASFFGFSSPAGMIGLSVFLAGIACALIVSKQMRRYIVRFLCVMLAGMTVFLAGMQYLDRDAVLFYTFSYSDELQAVVSVQNGTADITVLGDSRDYGLPLLSFLKARNVHTIRSLIFTERTTDSVTPIHLLNETLGVSHVIMHRQNAIYTPLSRAGYDVLTFSDAKYLPLYAGIDVRCSETGAVTVMIEKNGIKAGISTDQSISGANVQFLRVNNLKTLCTTEGIYSIIMNAPPDFVLKGGDHVFSAPPSVTVRVDKSGRISVWR